MTLGGIILAAGASRRMGRPKALLPVDPDGTFVARIHATLTAAGLDRLVVVVRAELEDDIARAVPHARLAVNDAPERGQLSSLLVGIDALAPSDAVLVTLIDLPLVHTETVRRIVDAWRRTRAPLVRPICAGHHGHPVIFGPPLLTDLRAADQASGAKPVVRAYAAAAVDVPVDDPGTVRDVDTPKDYSDMVHGEQS
jgi:CTP:molybdopterin cytidylyltransferase MocA